MTTVRVIGAGAAFTGAAACVALCASWIAPDTHIDPRAPVRAAEAASAPLRPHSTGTADIGPLTVAANEPVTPRSETREPNANPSPITAPTSRMAPRPTATPAPATVEVLRQDRAEDAPAVTPPTPVVTAEPPADVARDPEPTAEPQPTAEPTPTSEPVEPVTEPEPTEPAETTPPVEVPDVDVDIEVSTEPEVAP